MRNLASELLTEILARHYDSNFAFFLRKRKKIIGPACVSEPDLFRNPARISHVGKLLSYLILYMKQSDSCILTGDGGINLDRNGNKNPTEERKGEAEGQSQLEEAEKQDPTGSTEEAGEIPVSTIQDSQKEEVATQILA